MNIKKTPVSKLCVTSYENLQVNKLKSNSLNLFLLT